jgi:hypothetical protein
VPQQIALGTRSAVSEGAYPDSYWRSLFYFNVYRLIVGALLLMTAAVFEDSVFGSRSLTLFVYAAVGYVVFSLCAFLTITSHRPDFGLQLGFQVFGDLVFVTVLVYASGGVSSGLGLLLLASLAAAGIISRGRQGGLARSGRPFPLSLPQEPIKFTLPDAVAAALAAGQEAPQRALAQPAAHRLLVDLE